MHVGGNPAGPLPPSGHGSAYTDNDHNVELVEFPWGNAHSPLAVGSHITAPSSQLTPSAHAGNNSYNDIVDQEATGATFRPAAVFGQYYEQGVGLSEQYDNISFALQSNQNTLTIPPSNVGRRGDGDRQGPRGTGVEEVLF